MTGCVILEATSVAELIGYVRGRAVDGVIIDSSVVDMERMAPLGRIERYSTVPLLISAKLSRGFAQLALNVERWLNPQLFFEEIDDERIRAFLLTLSPPRTRVLLVKRLTETLGRLPRDIVTAIHMLAEVDPREQTVTRLASLTGRSCRGVFGALRATGVPRPHRLVEAIVCANAWAYSRDRGFTDTDMARKVGRSTPRTLWALVFRIAGVCERHSLATLKEDTLVDRLGSAVTGRTR
jgi:hypothetical protein